MGKINRNRVGLYSILLRRLDEISKTSNSEIIPLPVVFEKICRNFSIKKEECWEILFLLRDLGVIDIIPYHGIKINFRKKDNDIVLILKSSVGIKN